MSYIEVNNLWKTYGDQVVLENVNLSVEKGEFVTIVGASGCGKSTFLRMLLGQEQPSKGEIVHDGKPLAPEPDQHRGIVFQKYSVFPHLTVLNNVILGVEFTKNRLFGKLFGASKKQAIEKARVLINAVGLSHAENKYPHELSGGMQQRLAIAQSLIKEPEILLLDEPFGALDPGIRADMHELVLNLWRETGTTIFMVTHDLKEGFYLGTRLWVFDKLRHDLHAPERFGAGVTYDLPIGRCEERLYESIQTNVDNTARKAEAA
ncbi:MAG: ABC transporter ATP-binding protein [Pseudomonadales bacterium]|nr:ABC transporter ATP-binding protein [Pseudomonadales bacterium]